MHGKITSGALMTSLVLHGIIAFIAGLHLLTQTDQFKDLMGIEVLQSQKSPKPKIGRSFVKPAVKPTVPIQHTVMEQIQIQPRMDTMFYPRFKDPNRRRS